MAPLRAGLLRLTVKLQRRSATGSRDAANRQVFAWSDIWTTRADVRDLSGRELEIARTTQGNVSTKITVRQPPPNITVGSQDRWYVERDGRTLEIGYVSTDPEYRMIETLCGETL